MNLSFAAWVKRISRDLEAGGTVVRRVRFELVDEGTVIQVWDIEDLSDADAFVTEVEELIAALAEDWPARRHRTQFVAEDGAGGTRGTYPRSIHGRNKEALAKPSADLKAQTDAMAALTRTMQFTLEMANSQLEVTRNVITAQGNAFAQQTELIIALRAEAAVKPPLVSADNANALIGGLLKELPDLIEHFRAAGKSNGAH